MHTLKTEVTAAFTAAISSSEVSEMPAASQSTTELCRPPQHDQRASLQRLHDQVLLSDAAEDHLFQLLLGSRTCVPAKRVQNGVRW